MQVIVGGSVMLSCAIWPRLPMGRIQSRSRESLTSHPRTRNFLLSRCRCYGRGQWLDISKFVDGLEQQERRGFRDIHTHIKLLTVPGSAKIQKMTHAKAIEECTGISQYKMV